MLEGAPCWSRGSGFPRLAQLGSAAQACLEVNGFPGGSRFIDALIVADVDATGMFDDLVLDDVDAETGRGRKGNMAIDHFRRVSDDILTPFPIELSADTYSPVGNIGDIGRLEK
jgi:hypothetical protein